jgi:Ni/Co efflux regulator RcnB
MKFRALLISLALAFAGLAGPGVVLAGSADAATATHSAVAKHKHHKHKHKHKKKHHKKKHKQNKHNRCDSNYSGACVPIASDVDCAGGSGNGPRYVAGPVYVVGSDVYDLDTDGDGVGCDG